MENIIFGQKKFSPKVLFSILYFSVVVWDKFKIITYLYRDMTWQYELEKESHHVIPMVS